MGGVWRGWQVSFTVARPNIHLGYPNFSIVSSNIANTVDHLFTKNGDFCEETQRTRLGMKKFEVAIATAVFAILATSGARAQERPGNVEIGVTGGTEGIGPELSYRIDQHIGVRANATFLGFSHGVRSDGIQYDGHADLSSGGVMIDIYPFRGGFYLSGGARINGNHGRLIATPSQDTRIGGTVFTPTQIGSITGQGDTRNFAPQASLGYIANVGPHFSIGFEAGALFQGSIRISDFQSNGTLSNNSVYIAQLQLQQAQVQNDVNPYRVYPIGHIRLGYRF